MSFWFAATNWQPNKNSFYDKLYPLGLDFNYGMARLPLGYDNRNSKDKIIPNTQALARQHRYIVKDKLFYYNMFLAFEDDIRSRDIMCNIMAMSEEIDWLRAQAPTTTTTLDDLPKNGNDYKQSKFYVQMTRQKLGGVIPGFVQVEVMLKETEHGAHKWVVPILLDYNFEQADGSMQQHHVNPKICRSLSCGPMRPAPPRIILKLNLWKDMISLILGAQEVLIEFEYPRDSDAGSEIHLSLTDLAFLVASPKVGKIK
jgi:hypothetical protein